jgi:hypothetical protein
MRNEKGGKGEEERQRRNETGGKGDDERKRRKKGR